MRRLPGDVGQRGTYQGRWLCAGETPRTLLPRPPPPSCMLHPRHLPGRQVLSIRSYGVTRTQATQIESIVRMAGRDTKLEPQAMKHMCAADQTKHKPSYLLESADNMTEYEHHSFVQHASFVAVDRGKYYV